jgi:alkylated DNA repair dioxygenase AlkB
VQHYGYIYDYTSRGIRPDSYIGPLPAWLQSLAADLVQHSVTQDLPDQVIINEYLPGQGIAAHIDCVPCFAETIMSLSLGAPTTMIFANERAAGREEMILAANSLLVLTGPARYEWTHAIPARKSDIINGQRVARGRRVSLTFRQVIT